MPLEYNKVYNVGARDNIVLPWKLGTYQVSHQINGEDTAWVDIDGSDSGGSGSGGDPPSLENSLRMEVVGREYVATWQGSDSKGTTYEWIMSAYDGSNKSLSDTTSSTSIRFQTSEWGSPCLIRVTPIRNGIRGSYEEWSAALPVDKPSSPSISIVNESVLNFNWQSMPRATKYELTYTLDGINTSVITEEIIYQIDVTDVPNKPIHGFSGVSATVTGIDVRGGKGETSDNASLSLIPGWEIRPTPTATYSNNQLTFNVIPGDIAPDLISNYRWSYSFGDFLIPDEWTSAPQLIINDPSTASDYEFRVKVYGGFGGSSASNVGRAESNTAWFRVP